jgi:hypothetical protein
MRGPSDDMLGREAVGGRAGRRGVVGRAVQRRRACWEVRECRQDGQRRDDVDGGRCADAGVTSCRVAPRRQGASVSERLQLVLCFLASLAAAGQLVAFRCGRALATARGRKRYPSCVGAAGTASAVSQHSRGSVGLYGRGKTESINQGRKYVVKCLASCTVQAPTSCPGRAAVTWVLTRR